MSSKKKVNAVGLYLKDLKRQDMSNIYDFKMASIKFKSLSVQKRDYYEVQAKKINDKAEPVVYTTQRDTLGRNLKELNDMDKRRSEWYSNSIKFVKNISKSENVMHRDFYIAKVSGVDFNRAAEQEASFATSEICLIKFSFAEGVKKELTLFPDVLSVPPGFRQSLYEDLEESVGWKPDTFRNNHPIDFCIKEIRSFFDNKVDEPIFVPTKDQQLTLGMAFYHLYKEGNRVCPWIESFQDWGLNTKIYQLEYLVAEVMRSRYKLNNPNDDKKDISVSLVLDYWLRVMMDIAPEWCERHQRYGLANQCCTNILKKHLYISFVIMVMVIGEEMPKIDELVSENFYRNLDLILPDSMQGNHDEDDIENTTDAFKSDWNDYYEKSGIEDVINTLGGVTINGRGSSNVMTVQSAQARRLEIGRGRGTIKSNLANKNNLPGRKIRLPDVIC